jgi:hypothetical protein
VTFTEFATSFRCRPRHSFYEARCGYTATKASLTVKVPFRLKLPGNGAPRKRREAVTGVKLSCANSAVMAALMMAPKKPEEAVA